MKRNITLFCLFLNFYFLFLNLVNAQTPVSGGIYSNTTWTKAKSPYIVTDTVVVFPGATLTIEPGVTVKFADKQLLEIRQANLIVLGSKTDSITFTSNSSKPHAGIWSGIYLNALTKMTTFNYCNFRYAYYALATYNNYGHKINIKNSDFKNNYSGLGDLEEGNGNVVIDSCNFIYNTYGTGRLAYSTLNNCNLSNNKIAIGGEYYASDDMTIENCIINFNKIGSFIDEESFVTNCMIKSNTTAGILLYVEYKGGSITNCQISNNGVGICDSATDDAISIKWNIIEYNKIGIRVADYYNDTIYCNKICNNTIYDLYWNTNHNTSLLKYNDWGTKDSATISKHIYDGYDNVKLGLVKFIPIDTTKCYLTGCNLQLSVSVTNATCDTCHNGSATAHVSYGIPPYTWTWYTSPIQTTQMAKSLKPGKYTVCVTDAKGCTTCNKSVIVDSINCKGFSISDQSSNTSCNYCNDGKAWVNIKGGTPPYTFTWYTKIMQTTDTIYGLTQGIYSVCANDLHGCVACDTVVVKTAPCSAHFDLYPTSTPHVYNAVNMASGVAPLKYLWSWGDGTYDSTAYPSHTYNTAGYYKICLTITDNVGCKNTFCNLYYLMKSGNPVIQVDVIPYTVGINEVSTINYQLSTIYPNPASDLIIINSPNPSPCLITIKNLQGQEVMKQRTEHSAQSTINVSGLSNGIYFITLQNEKLNYVTKLIINH